jgi:hypothetical protein
MTPFELLGSLAADSMSPIYVGTLVQILCHSRNLEPENLAQLAFDGGLPGRRNASAPLQNVFPCELDHEMTPTRGLVLEAVGFIEKDLVRTQWSVRRTNGGTHQAVQILEILPASELVRREND